MSKTQLISDLTTKTGLTKGQVTDVLDNLVAVATESLRTTGEFTLPGLVKIAAKDKAATAERQGINPFTKLPVTIAAKPASKKLAARPVAALKKTIV